MEGKYLLVLPTPPPECTTLSTAVKPSFLTTTEAGEGAPIRTPSSFPVLSGHSLLTPSWDTRLPLAISSQGYISVPAQTILLCIPSKGGWGLGHSRQAVQTTVLVSHGLEECT